MQPGLHDDRLVQQDPVGRRALGDPVVGPGRELFEGVGLGQDPVGQERVREQGPAGQEQHAEGEQQAQGVPGLGGGRTGCRGRGRGCGAVPDHLGVGGRPGCGSGRRRLPAHPGFRHSITYRKDRYRVGQIEVKPSMAFHSFQVFSFRKLMIVLS